MPKYGIFSSSTERSSATWLSAVAGSPGPLDMKKPSGLTAWTSARVAVAGSTCTRTPRSAKRIGVMRLMPRSMAAMLNRGSPSQPQSLGSTV